MYFSILFVCHFRFRCRRQLPSVRFRFRRNCHLPKKTISLLFQIIGVFGAGYQMDSGSENISAQPSFVRFDRMRSRLYEHSRCNLSRASPNQDSYLIKVHLMNAMNCLVNVRNRLHQVRNQLGPFETTTDD